MLIGPPPPARSYLDAGADPARGPRDRRARHPSRLRLPVRERGVSPGRSSSAGLTWVGPPPSAIEQMGDKISARNLMAAAGVPVAAGTTEPVTRRRARREAAAALIGYPVMVKAAAGGGGIGMSAAAGPGAAGGGVRDGPLPRGAVLRQPGDPAGALRDAGPARGGADPRAGRRPRAGPRRAGLLGAAPAPEGGRGDPVARGSAPACGPGCWRPRSGPGRRSATWAPGRSSSWWTRGPATSRSWR